MTGIVWWEIEVGDPDAFQRFHGDLWGWEFRREFEDSELGADYWVVVADGVGIGGLQRAGDDVAPQSAVRLYVAVGDLEATLARAVAAGGRVLRERTELGGEDRWFGIVEDPCGIAFGLWTASAPDWRGRVPASVRYSRRSS